MSDRLTVVGGTYYENCIDPEADDFYGSGMRGAAALSGKGLTINLISCIAKRDLNLAHSICSTFDIQPEFHFIDKTIIFQYYHPLSLPEIFGLPDNGTSVKLADCTSTNILFYGMIEAQIEVHGKRVVYDPQNHISFVETGSTANHLALVLNKKEAHL
ncbi:MAG TPA: hypothetical protein VFI06_12795, partial [Chitinophagaceae bacterium]|nr:hypothetical protein [Chitinophagaceae bacterium]